jgi:hypothetical protein
MGMGRQGYVTASLLLGQTDFTLCTGDRVGLRAGRTGVEKRKSLTLIRLRTPKNPAVERRYTGCAVSATNF